MLPMHTISTPDIDTVNMSTIEESYDRHALYAGKEEEDFEESYADY